VGERAASGLLERRRDSGELYHRLAPGVYGLDGLKLTRHELESRWSVLDPGDHHQSSLLLLIFRQLNR
jgi:hypothetical protein